MDRLLEKYFVSVGTGSDVNAITLNSPRTGVENAT